MRMAFRRQAHLIIIERVDKILFSLPASNQYGGNMNILILQGSPRLHGNTAKMAQAFARGAQSASHAVNLVNVFEKDIHDCTACEYCHTKGHGTCIQKDGMQDIYPLLLDADALVLASPIYYHGVSGQLKCCIDRFYSCLYPKRRQKLSMIAMLLNSGAPDVYEGAIYSFRNDFLGYLGLKDAGLFTACGDPSKALIKEIEAHAAAL